MSFNVNAEETKIPGVYLAASNALADAPAGALIDGKPIRAYAPHPEFDQLIYVTTEHPDTLAFLPDAVLDWDD